MPSLASLVPTACLPELLAKGQVVKSADASGSPSLAPRHPASGEMARLVSGEKPNLLVEALYLYPRPRPLDPAAELRELYGTILATSSLEGIQYWSVSRGRYRTFYTESYRIDAPDSKRRIPDASAPTGRLPSSGFYYAFQRDTTFGPNVYRCDYRVYPEAVYLESTNLTSLNYLSIPILPENKLRIRLLVVQADEAILFYVVNSAQTPSVSIVHDRVRESISNRTEALFKWFALRRGTKGFPG